MRAVANGREPISSRCQVFNSKLARFAVTKQLRGIDERQHLELKARPVGRRSSYTVGSFFGGGWEGQGGGGIIRAFGFERRSF
jgi:hypothetical protein